MPALSHTLDHLKYFNILYITALPIFNYQTYFWLNTQPSQNSWDFSSVKSHALPVQYTGGSSSISDWGLHGSKTIYTMQLMQPQWLPVWLFLIHGVSVAEIFLVEIECYILVIALTSLKKTMHFKSAKTTAQTLSISDRVAVLSLSSRLLKSAL